MIDIVATLVSEIGWDSALFLLAIQQLYTPDELHPTGGTKLRKLISQPAPGVVAAIEAVYKHNDDLNREELIKRLNGDLPRAWEFEVKAKDISADQSGGD